MKNTDKDIIERFKQFDFDPQDKKQQQIFNKITSPAPVKKKNRNSRFFFAAAIGCAAALFIVVGNNFHHLNDDIIVNDKKERVEIKDYSDVSAQPAVDIQQQERSAVNTGEKVSFTFNVVAIEGGKEVPLESAYIWIDDKITGKTDDKGSWEKKIVPGKIKAKVLARDYEEVAFEQEAIAGNAGTVKVVLKPSEVKAKRWHGRERVIRSERLQEAASEKAEYDAIAYETAAAVPAPQASYDAARSSEKVRRKAAQPAQSVSEDAKMVLATGGAVSPKTAYEQAALQAYYSYSELDYISMQNESYKKYEENSFKSVVSDPLSTFSADVDVAAYNIFRRSIMRGDMSNPDSVRTEEFLNYFDYSYPQPQGADLVSMNFEYTASPWNAGLHLVKIGIKAKDIDKNNLPASNLVFLIDVSGSMDQESRLPLVKKSMKMLVDQLRPQDRVSIVTYANGVNERLSGAKGSEKEMIKNVIDSLYASGGTNGSEGLKLAYETAKKNFIIKGNNRVILATDGDFNIGPRSDSELENQITAARESGVFLSVLGFGMGNYKDSKMQTIANKGNGNYAYINDLFEARKTLVKEFGATLFTVAKDVKLQVEFNPAYVAAYRLVGYEKRNLSTQDFNDDKKDAGEMGEGHTVTAIYEIIPQGVESEFLPDVEKLKYTKTEGKSDDGDVLTLKLRYKEPDSDTSKLMEKTLKQNVYVPFDKSSDDMRFAASVTQFCQILKDTPYKGSMTIEEVISTAKKAKGADEEGYRADFVKMVEMYTMIQDNRQ